MAHISVPHGHQAPHERPITGTVTAAERVDYSRPDWMRQTHRVLADFTCPNCGASGLENIADWNILADVVRCASCSSITSLRALREGTIPRGLR